LRSYRSDDPGAGLVELDAGLPTPTLILSVPICDCLVEMDRNEAPSEVIKGTGTLKEGEECGDFASVGQS
jgi:hypothetical protein